MQAVFPVMSIDRLVSLASSHLQEGRLDLAESHYRDALRTDPTHRDACLGLAQVLVRRNCFDEAVGWLTRLLHQPGDPVAVHRQLGFALACGGHHRRALDHLERTLAADPDDAATLHLVANLQQALGLASAAATTYRRALSVRPLITIAAVVAPPEFRALFIFGPGAGNTPIEYLTAQARFESNVITLLPDAGYDFERLRGYADVVVNLISDVDRGHALLAPAQAFAERIGAPLVNAPQRIARTRRDAVAQQLAQTPGCRVPPTRLWPAAELCAACAQASGAGLAFALLVRPAGTHGGEAFEKMEDARQLLAFVERHAANHYYVTPFVDYRSADGYFRKYRFVYVDGEILPYHLAIDDQWKVHHVTTRMAELRWMQDEERAFLDDPWRVFGTAQRASLHAVRETIGLDYFGIDCALDAAGALVVFEVNASMLVHGNNERFPYKRGAVERIRQAFYAMLARRARAGNAGPA
jgi:glutathione synthase/RimK-type ligase-like ATP-grasp enzyme